MPKWVERNQKGGSAPSFSAMGGAEGEGWMAKAKKYWMQIAIAFVAVLLVVFFATSGFGWWAKKDMAGMERDYIIEDSEKYLIDNADLNTNVAMASMTAEGFNTKEYAMMTEERSRPGMSAGMEAEHDYTENLESEAKTIGEFLQG